MEAEIVKVGGATLVEGNPVWDANNPVGDETSDIEPIGQLDAFQALGFASVPVAGAEAVIIRECGGRDGVCVGGRDVRNADIVGKLGPGDCAMFATGPGAVAQVQCKAKKRQVVLATEDSKGRTMVALLDGKNDKFQIAALGAIIQVDEKGDIAITNAQGTGILIQGGKIHLLGEIALPGMRPGFALMQGPPTGSPGGGAAAPLLAVQAVSK
jgi:hypothetical protein